MQNHQFDLSAGESIRLGEFIVTLLDVEGEAAVLEIEGPDGEITMEQIEASEINHEALDEEPVLV